MSLLSPPAQESLPRGLVWFSFFQHRVACEVLWVLGEVARVACEVFVFSAQIACEVL